MQFVQKSQLLGVGLPLLASENFKHYTIQVRYVLVFLQMHSHKVSNIILGYKTSTTNQKGLGTTKKYRHNA